MQKDHKFFDDMARLASGVAGNFLEIKRDVEEMIAAQMEKLLHKMRLSTKEEVDAALATMSKIREEQEIIKKRLETLENGTNINI